MRRPLSKIAHQALLPVFFRTQLQDLLFPQEVHRESTRNAIGKLLYGRSFEVFRIILEKQRVAGFVELDDLPLQHWIGLPAAVLEVVHLSFEKGILFE